MGYIEMKCPICGTHREFEGSWVRCPKCQKIWPIDELEEIPVAPNKVYGEDIE